MTTSAQSCEFVPVVVDTGDTEMEAAEDPSRGEAHASGDEARALANALALSESLVTWISRALDGEPISDFAESFPLVRRVAEIMAANFALENESRRLAVEVKRLESHIFGYQARLAEIELRHRHVLRTLRGEIRVPQERSDSEDGIAE